MTSLLSDSHSHMFYITSTTAKVSQYYPLLFWLFLVI